MADQRQQKLTQWVLNYTREQKIPTTDRFSLEPLHGDASFRRYFRVCIANKKLLAVDAPPTTEDTRAFVRIAGILAQAGIIVPVVVAVDYEQGFLLVSDFGDRLYFSLLASDGVEQLYERSIVALVKMQSIKNVSLPCYDERLLRQELELFSIWFMEQLLTLSPTDEDSRIVNECCDLIVQTVLEQPTVFVHRDYHSRNLLDVGRDMPAVIDFQGAVQGPVTYDLVSLLKDCYVTWPMSMTEEWLALYISLAQREHVLAPVSTDTLVRWYDFTGLQRHIKVLGIFARLNCRDGKSGYLADLPRVITYIRDVCTKYDELKLFSHWFQDRVMSSVSQSGWYSRES